MKKHYYPCNSSVLWAMLVKLFIRYVLWFGYCLFFLVLFVCSLNNEVVVFCVCVIFFVIKTKWLSCLHLVVLLPFLFFFLIFVFGLYFVLLKKDDKERTKQNPQKSAKKGPKIVSVSTVVFTNSFPIFGGWARKCSFCWKRYKIVVSAYFEKGKMAQNVQKVESKLGPRLSPDLVQACCANNWTKFWLKKMVIGVFLLPLFSLKKEEDFWKTEKERRRKLLDQVLTQRRPFLDQVLTLQCMYIYIYIYAGRAVWVPRFFKKRGGSGST